MHIFKLILLFLCAILPGVVHAVTCNVTSIARSTVNLSGDISVPRDAVVGNTIGPVYGPYQSQAGNFNCDHIPNLYLSFDSPLVQSSSAGVYKTNLPGIGVKVWSSFSGTTVVGNSPVYWYKNNANSSGAWIAAIYLQFYVLDKNVGKGTISLPMPLVKALTDTSNAYAYLTLNSSVTVTPQKGCSVTTPNQTVILSDAKVVDLKNNPGRYADGKNFNIGITCTPETKVSVKFSGTAMTGKNNVLANQSRGGDSSGDSVGIQMLYKNNPIPLDQTILAIDGAQSVDELSFTAHYFYNGASNLQAGDVSAITTFTITYQ